MEKPNPIATGSSKGANMMQLSLYSSYFHDYSPEEMVKLFASKGWTRAELSNEHSAMLLQRGRPDQIGRQFKRFAQDRGMLFLQGHLWLTCDIAGPDRNQVVDQLKTWLDLYQAIGIRAAVLHPAGYARYAAGDDEKK
jgi:sugar phosphate isomerase/epimerase